MEERKPREHRRGEGSVYPDGDRWVAAFSLGVDAKGKRRRIKRTAPDEDTAKAYLARLQRQYGHGGDVASLRLDAYLSDWLDSVEHTVAPSSWERYEQIVRVHIKPVLGPIRVGELRPADVRRLIRDRLVAGRHPQTVVSIVTVLKGALSQAVRDGELDRNVAQMVELPRVEREPVEALTPEMADRIIEAVRGDRHEALYVLLLGTGMRVGEACALDWRDLRLPKGGAKLTGEESVFIRRGKTRSARRVIPLVGWVARAMIAHRARCTIVGAGAPVFTGERSGERLKPDVPGDQFPLLMTNAGLPRLTVHKLRHGTATLLLQKGVPMRVISEVLGHASPAITASTYAHVSEDSKRGALDALDEHWAEDGSLNGSQAV